MRLLLEGTLRLPLPNFRHVYSVDTGSFSTRMPPWTRQQRK